MNYFPKMAGKRNQLNNFSNRAAAASHCAASCGVKVCSSKEFRTTSRAASCDSRWPSAMAWIENVAQRGAFGRAGEHGNFQRVGGELVQRGVLAAAADDVQPLDFFADEPLECGAA